MYMKPGMTEKAWDLIEKMKKGWEGSNQSIAVYSASYSGQPQIITSRRLKGGLKELDATGNTFADNYRKANGPDSWSDFLNSYADVFSEPLERDADVTDRPEFEINKLPLSTGDTRCLAVIYLKFNEQCRSLYLPTHQCRSDRPGSDRRLFVITTKSFSPFQIIPLPSPCYWFLLNLKQLL